MPRHVFCHLALIDESKNKIQCSKYNICNNDYICICFTYVKFFITFKVLIHYSLTHVQGVNKNYVKQSTILVILSVVFYLFGLRLFEQYFH